MKRSKPSESASGHQEREPRQVRLPGFTADKEVGLGEVVKRATSLIGVRPCASCLERAAALNRRLVFTGRR